MYVRVRYSWMREHSAQQAADAAALRTHLHDEVSLCKSMSLDLEAGLKEMKGQLVTEEDLLQSTEGLHAQLKDAKEQTRDALDRQTEEVRDQLLKLEAATNDRFRVEADASRERLVMVSGELAEKIGSVAMAVKQDMSSLRDSVRKEIEDAQGDLKGRVQDVEVLVLQEKADREEQLGRLQDKHEMRMEGLEDQVGGLLDVVERGKREEECGELVEGGAGVVSTSARDDSGDPCF